MKMGRMLAFLGHLLQWNHWSWPPPLACNKLFAAESRDHGVCGPVFKSCEGVPVLKDDGSAVVIL